MEQKQVSNGGNPTFSVKVTKEVYELVNILASGLAHGTNGNDLLKMFIHAFIESARHDGPVSPEIRTFLNLLKLDPSWHKAFNFADVTARSEIAQVILILQQPGRHGFGLTMIDRPFMDDARMTRCVDDILERLVNVAMPGLYRKLRFIIEKLECGSLREALIILCEEKAELILNESDQAELPGYGDRHDFGRTIEYGKQYKHVPHRTPDSVANQQQTIKFDMYDQIQADEEARRDDLESEIGFRPHGEEW